jgi:Mn-dependent DtxR family transcriptional regulator
MWRLREERLKLMDKVLEIVGQAGKPVSIDYVAHHLGVSWHTARGLLLELAIKGKLKVIDTTKGYIFTRGDA